MTPSKKHPPPDLEDIQLHAVDSSHSQQTANIMSSSPEEHLLIPPDNVQDDFTDDGFVQRVRSSLKEKGTWRKFLHAPPTDSAGLDRAATMPDEHGLNNVGVRLLHSIQRSIALCL